MAELWTTNMDLDIPGTLQPEFTQNNRQLVEFECMQRLSKLQLSLSLCAANSKALTASTGEQVALSGTNSSEGISNVAKTLEVSAGLNMAIQRFKTETISNNDNEGNTQFRWVL